MKDKLDEILLSNNVVENFYNNYQNLEFRNWLISLLPEIEDCRTTMQDNPWHIYNCLDHILHSVDEINKQTINLEYSTRRMLAYTMFLHDIGKPESKIRRYSNLYKREVDSFSNHNIASVKIAERVLDKLGFELYAKELILKLVKEHDLFLSLTLEEDINPRKRILTKALFKQIIDELDANNAKTLMKYLLMIGKADNHAQNPQMTPQSLKMLDVMTDMLQEL